MPCNLTKYTPITAVKNINTIVLNVPKKLPNCINVAISTTGKTINKNIKI